VPVHYRGKRKGSNECCRWVSPGALHLFDQSQLIVDAINSVGLIVRGKSPRGPTRWSVVNCWQPAK